MSQNENKEVMLNAFFFVVNLFLWSGEVMGTIDIEHLQIYMRNTWFYINF